MSVIDGEVNLNHAGADRVLRAGEQASYKCVDCPGRSER